MVLFNFRERERRKELFKIFECLADVLNIRGDRRTKSHIVQEVSKPNSLGLATLGPKKLIICFSGPPVSPSTTTSNLSLTNNSNNSDNISDLVQLNQDSGKENHVC